MSYLLIALTLLFSEAASPHEDYTRLRVAGVVEFTKGRYSEAETLILKSLDAARKSSNEYSMALSYAALGDLYQTQFQFGDAEKHYRKALFILTSAPDRGHATAIVWRNLGSALTAQMRYDEALKMIKRASHLVAKHHVHDARLDAAISNSFGVAYFHKGDLRKAERYFLQAAEFPTAARNSLAADMWEVMNNLGRVYDTMRRFSEAENAYRRSLQLVTAAFGESHTHTAIVLGNLGTLYALTKRYDEAEAEYRRGLAILEQAGPNADDVLLMRTLYGLGVTYVHKGETVRAQSLLGRATEIARKRGLRENMPETISILEAYASVIKDRSNPEVERLQVEMSRMRAVMAFTVPVGQAK